MLKRIALMVVTSFVLFPTSGFATTDNDITNLDLQRNELLKRVTSGLVSGRISVEDAQRVRTELDNIVQLETRAKEDPVSAPTRISEISSYLQQVNGHIDTFTHPNKVWLGIDANDRTLERKLTDALDHKTLSKEKAEAFKVQLDELRSRESNGDPSRGMEFDDAMSIAVDKQTLSGKIDNAIARK